MSRRPPIWVERLIERICLEDYSEEIIGDLYEYYGEVQHMNYAKRQLLFVRHVLSNVRPDLLKKPTINPKLKNFMDVINLSLKLNWRGFKANKIVTLLSLLILIIGSVSFQFVNAWLTNEKTTDQFHIVFGTSPFFLSGGDLPSPKHLIIFVPQRKPQQQQ